MKRGKLAGELNGKRYKALTDNGCEAKLSDAVVPIIAQDIHSLKFRFVGTGFFYRM